MLASTYLNEVFCWTNVRNIFKWTNPIVHVYNIRQIMYWPWLTLLRNIVQSEVACLRQDEATNFSQHFFGTIPGNSDILPTIYAWSEQEWHIAKWSSLILRNFAIQSGNKPKTEKSAKPTSLNGAQHMSNRTKECLKIFFRMLWLTRSLLVQVFNYAEIAWFFANDTY